MSNQQSVMKSRRDQIDFIVRFSILAALEAICCFVLGSIPLSFSPSVVATLMMIPVMATSIFLGPKAGLGMGLLAGTFSFIIWTFFPPAASIAFAFLFTPFAPLGNFWSLVICFVPRGLAGLFSGIVFKVLKSKKTLSFVASGLVCSLTNTFLVTFLCLICFGNQMASVFGLELGKTISTVLISFILVNGTFEAVISVLISLGLSPNISQFITNRKPLE